MYVYNVGTKSRWCPQFTLTSALSSVPPCFLLVIFFSIFFFHSSLAFSLRQSVHDFLDFTFLKPSRRRIYVVVVRERIKHETLSLHSLKNEISSRCSPATCPRITSQCLFVIAKSLCKLELQSLFSFSFFFRVQMWGSVCAGCFPPAPGNNVPLFCE